MVKGNNTLFFYYDENGSATSFSYNGTMYFYVKNLQGDIVNIVDSNGTVLVRYDYDVFGKITAIKNGSNQAITNTASIAYLNPLRYRGYVYDDETGLYYLQSRYYDPVTGRFLNADIYTDTGSGSPLSTNMFAYCENNAVNTIDNYGDSPTRLSESNYARKIPSNVRVYVIFYENLKGKNGFRTQANNFYQYYAKSKNTKIVRAQTAAGFVIQWKAIPANTAYMFIFVHGEKGKLYFDKCEIAYKQTSKNDRSFSQLPLKKVSCQIWLFSCEGGIGGQNSAAAQLARRCIGTEVIAMTCNVSFSKDRNGLYYARPKAFCSGYFKAYKYYYRRGILCFSEREVYI